MARAADLISTAIDAMGVDEKHVVQVARSLREADLFVRETKSPRSWRASPRDAAHLIVALMSGCPAIHAAATVEAILNASLDSGSFAHLHQQPDWFRLRFANLFRENNGASSASISDAIEDMINIAINLPDTFRHWTTQFSFEIEQNSLCGIFAFGLTFGSILIEKHELAGGTLNFCAPDRQSGGMVVTARIGSSIIKAFAEKLGR